MTSSCSLIKTYIYKKEGKKIHQTNAKDATSDWTNSSRRLNLSSHLIHIFICQVQKGVKGSRLPSWRKDTFHPRKSYPIYKLLTQFQINHAQKLNFLFRSPNCHSTANQVLDKTYAPAVHVAYGRKLPPYQAVSPYRCHIV